MNQTPTVTASAPVRSHSRSLLAPRPTPHPTQPLPPQPPSPLLRFAAISFVKYSPELPILRDFRGELLQKRIYGRETLNSSYFSCVISTTSVVKFPLAIAIEFPSGDHPNPKIRSAVKCVNSRLVGFALRSARFTGCIHKFETSSRVNMYATPFPSGVQFSVGVESPLDATSGPTSYDAIISPPSTGKIPSCGVASICG